jgi:uncharacterized membrane protein
MAQSRATADVDGPAGRLEVRKISTTDVVDALIQGFEDFWEHPSHYAFAGLLYPIMMTVVGFWVSGQNVLPLLYPLATGFALLGPFIALIFYEISRRQELGLNTSWKHGFEALYSPALPSIAVVGLVLCALFITWLIVAQVLFTELFGNGAPASLTALFREIFTTVDGWILIVAGNVIGFLFAAEVLCISVVSFPLMLDRHVAPHLAIETSIRVTRTNLVPITLWGLIVAGLLALGMATLFVGLVIVMPVLGHATWHLYRKLIVPQPGRVTRAWMPNVPRSVRSARSPGTT